eukprot:TRINITY_DN43663_c0_g1_i1.p1 TRINITY_DN43663_c0_g1~~TRINITY_DN43663_c0_g1_i1.p1  ORF type:complete len:236 (+),score=25.53 TRINITY_DN43663_c0_g1_i1:88-795(+)
MCIRDRSSGSVPVGIPLHADVRLALEQSPGGMELSALRDAIQQTNSLPRTVKIMTLKAYLKSCDEVRIHERITEDGGDWVNLHVSELWPAPSEDYDPQQRELRLDAGALFPTVTKPVRVLPETHSHFEDFSAVPAELEPQIAVQDPLVAIREENEQLQLRIQALEAQVMELQEKEEASLCQICMENPKNVVLLPCMHFLYCATCVNAVPTIAISDTACPYCRGTVAGVLECRMNV